MPSFLVAPSPQVPRCDRRHDHGRLPAHRRG